jgi:hypothetical protein
MFLLTAASLPWFVSSKPVDIFLSVQYYYERIYIATLFLKQQQKSQIKANKLKSER